ncbi:MAG: helix-turn-helix transcriptional regulator, partial [Micromonosporaceae bacterium]|nr:helix-turn-helix transcriptional regulator [Micromonosporaceae bacterium]
MRGGVLAARRAVPEVPATLVRRPRLYAHLDRAVRRPVTLLRAPAGWGKTVLLASWLRDREPGGPVAWLAAGPGQFWAALAEALRVAGVPGVPEPAGQRGGAAEFDGPAYPERLADALARLPDPVTVVLDDAERSTGARPAGGSG